MGVLACLIPVLVGRADHLLLGWFCILQRFFTDLHYNFLLQAGASAHGYLLSRSGGGCTAMLCACIRDVHEVTQVMAFKEHDSDSSRSGVANCFSNLTASQPGAVEIMRRPGSEWKARGPDRGLIATRQSTYSSVCMGTSPNPWLGRARSASCSHLLDANARRDGCMQDGVWPGPDCKACPA